ncbi:MAG: adenine phosphoribosyltransferase [Bacteroidetes bacterium]|nr:adenine phosphoribosyltransferase [Bacteroidota bacterium]
MLEKRIKSTIRDIPNFPKEGIIFKDITPILKDTVLCEDITIELKNRFLEQPIHAVVGIESRGFLFGFKLATLLNVPFVMVRKPGKLPYKKIAQSYDLEYGSATVEMQLDEIKKGANVLIHDDLLATGGTAEAAAKLIHQQEGNIIGFCFLIELGFLKGREKLNNYSPKIVSLVNY